MYQEHNLASERRRVLLAEASVQRQASQVRALDRATRRADRAQRQLVRYRREAARLRSELAG
jgi:hypothetical protein